MSHTPSIALPKSLAGHSAAARVVTQTQVQRDRRSGIGLDWFSFFCANFQTGFGAFVMAYLTTEKWSQTDIGVVLTISGFVGLLGQIPGGAIVDRSRFKPVIAAISVLAIGAAALLVASSSVFAVILFAWVLHAAASCFIMPCILTISLALVGHEKMGKRVGRNATFAALGSAVAALGMGLCGEFISNQAVFFVTAGLTIPALIALWQIRAPKAAKPVRVVTQTIEKVKSSSVAADLMALARDRGMVVMAITISLYYLASASMLPLIGSMLTLRSAHSTTIYIAACMIVPQLMIAVLSPIVGGKAQSWGRRPLLLLGLASVPLRGLLLGAVIDPNVLVGVQILDGFCSAIIGVLMPLVASDATHSNGRFALAQGIFMTAMGVGASVSSTVAGVMTDKFGSSTAFYTLAAIAMLALIVPLVLMPETRPAKTAREDEGLRGKVEQPAT